MVHFLFGVCNWKAILFLASQDALEVMSVTHSLTHWLDVSIDLTDVTRMSEDTIKDLTGVILIVKK